MHDCRGRLIGYAGAVRQAAANAENPLHRFLSRRERNGKILDFDRSAFLYNGNRLKTPCDDLIVVEWFPAVWWLHQCGFPHVVALMGSAEHEMQADLIVEAVKPSSLVWVLPGWRPKGDDLAMTLLPAISPRRFVRWVKLGGDCQPTEMGAEEVKACFA